MSKLDGLDPAFREKVEKFLEDIKQYGIECIVTSGLRTIKEQDDLYAQGSTKQGRIVTKAKGGESAHNFGEAVDVCPTTQTHKLWWDAPDDVWNCMHKVAEGLGFVCGYDFKSIKDAPHLESTTWRIKQKMWREGALKLP